MEGIEINRPISEPWDIYFVLILNCLNQLSHWVVIFWQNLGTSKLKIYQVDQNFNTFFLGKLFRVSMTRDGQISQELDYLYQNYVNQFNQGLKRVNNLATVFMIRNALQKYCSFFHHSVSYRFTNMRSNIHLLLIKGMSLTGEKRENVEIT